MKRAMMIKKVNLGASDAFLYRLSDSPLEEKEITNVVVSSTTAPPYGDRVAVFQANEDGEIVSWEEIAEKIDTLDHEEVLIDLGYEIL